MLLTQHERMFLTAPKLQKNPVLKKKKRKIQAVNFLAHASTVMLTPAVVFIVIIEAKGG